MFFLAKTSVNSLKQTWTQFNITFAENVYFFVEITSWKYVSWKYTCILKIHKNTPSVFIFSLHSWWWWWWQQWWCHPQYLSYSALHLKQPQKNQHQLPKSLPFHLDPNIICLIHVNLDKNPFWNLTSFLPQTKGILPQREKKMFFSIPI